MEFALSQGSTEPQSFINMYWTIIANTGVHIQIGVKKLKKEHTIQKHILQR